MELESAVEIAQLTLQVEDAVGALERAWAKVTPERGGRSTLRQDWAALRRRLLPWADPEDGVLTAVFSDLEHPNHKLILEDLERKELVRPPSEAKPEIDRFVRDHLFGLRFFQHATAVRGLFALTIAVQDLLDHERDGHGPVRSRIMLWEDAFVSPALRSILGPAGPLGEALRDGGRARSWSERLLSSVS
ncbi:MAG: hypothetical protein HC923_09870 [Myxococcales bacterium]|nr:hypothetical protein [Myxococcales bacterium]